MDQVKAWVRDNELPEDANYVVDDFNVDEIEAWDEGE